jgi:two-component system sensor histidine kinase TctE
MKAHGGRVGFAFPDAGGFSVVLTFPRAAGVKVDDIETGEPPSR